MPASQTPIERCLMYESDSAIRGAVSNACPAPTSEGDEEELARYIIAAITIQRCYREFLKYPSTAASPGPLIDALQQTLLLDGLAEESRRTMVIELLTICKGSRTFPTQLKINAATPTAFLSSTNVTYPLTDRDVFRRVPYGDRLVRVELYRSKNDAREAKTEVNIAPPSFPLPIVLRLTPLLGVLQFNGDLQRTYLVSPHLEERDTLRNYIAYEANVNRESIHLSPITQLRDAAQALLFLHTNGIIHGNIKPSAVVVDDNGRARLSGVGMGLLEPAVGSMNSLATPTFTDYLWMSPELLQAHVDGGLALPTKESDIYAFGLLAYEVYTGEEPFAEIRGKSTAYTLIPRIYKAVVERNERPPQLLLDSNAYVLNGLTDDTWDLIQRCWATDPSDRPSAQELPNSPLRCRPISGTEAGVREVHCLKDSLCVWKTPHLELSSRALLQATTSQSSLSSLPRNTPNTGTLSLPGVTKARPCLVRSPRRPYTQLLEYQELDRVESVTAVERHAGVGVHVEFTREVPLSFPRNPVSIIAAKPLPLASSIQTSFPPSLVSFSLRSHSEISPSRSTDVLVQYQGVLGVVHSSHWLTSPKKGLLSLGLALWRFTSYAPVPTYTSPSESSANYRHELGVEGLRSWWVRLNCDDVGKGLDMSKRAGRWEEEAKEPLRFRRHGVLFPSGFLALLRLHPSDALYYCQRATEWNSAPSEAVLPKTSSRLTMRKSVCALRSAGCERSGGIGSEGESEPGDFTLRSDWWCVDQGVRIRWSMRKWVKGGMREEMQEGERSDEEGFGYDAMDYGERHSSRGHLLRANSILKDVVYPYQDSDRRTPPRSYRTCPKLSYEIPDTDVARSKLAVGENDRAYVFHDVVEALGILRQQFRRAGGREG
ncbi:hypothetical protein NMY22_g8538 [Coprinellus aureogranulatus]|nr:hypothetical protein NMY22_g8538 [Coprinellus aureogranulatus]